MNRFKIGDRVTYMLINGYIVHGEVLAKSRGGSCNPMSEAHAWWDIKLEYSILYDCEPGSMRLESPILELSRALDA